MKLSEFKAWFEGFTEGMEGAPTVAQFHRIKERIAEIDGVAVTMINADYPARYHAAMDIDGSFAGVVCGYDAASLKNYAGVDANTVMRALGKTEAEAA